MSVNGVGTLHLKHLNDVDYFSLMKATQTVFDLKGQNVVIMLEDFLLLLFPQCIHSLSEKRGHTRSDPLNPA